MLLIQNKTILHLSSLHSATNNVNNNNINNPGKLVPELSETLTQYATLTVLKFLTSTPAFLPRPPSLPLKFNIKENPGKQLKKHEETEDKNTHFFYTCLILDLPRPLANCWFPNMHKRTPKHQNPALHYLTATYLFWQDNIGYFLCQQCINNANGFSNSFNQIRYHIKQQFMYDTCSNKKQFLQTHKF